MEKDRRPIFGDGASVLRQAILEQAIRDYESALRCRLKGECSRHSIVRLEGFFLSDYGQFLSDGHGEDIIRKCKSRVEGNTVRMEIHCQGFTDAQRRRLVEDLTAFLAGRYPGAIVVRGGGRRG